MPRDTHHEKDVQALKDDASAAFDKDMAAHDPPGQAKKADTVPPFNYERPTILLEDGAVRDVPPGSITNREGRDWRVLDEAAGQLYEHCATDDASGRWIYRPVK